MLAIIYENEVEHTYIGCACVTYVCMDNASWLVLFFNVTLPKFCITAEMMKIYGLKRLVPV